LPTGHIEHYVVPMSADLSSAQADPPLRAVRAAKGLTLRTVAQRSGIDPGHLSKVERGQKQLSVESLHRLAVVLELSELAKLLAPYVGTKEGSLMAAASLRPTRRSSTGIRNDDGAAVAPAAPSVESVPVSTPAKK